MRFSNLHWTMVIALGWIALIGPGGIEGKLFPAVVDVQLSAVQDPNNIQYTLVSGSFEKVRAGCTDPEIEWWLGDRNVSWVDVPLDWGKPEIRDDGYQVFTDWRARAAPPLVLEGETFSDVSHQCTTTILGLRLKHPWRTITTFWR